MANRWETVADFVFLGSKIAADGDCSHEIKRRLFLGRKVMTSLDSISRIFPGGSDGKASAYNPYHVGDPGSIPGSEDLLEKEMATHSIIAWKIP